MLRNQRDEVLCCPAKLVPFHLLCYANLKKYVFDHHFSFPVLSTKWTITGFGTHSKFIDQAAKQYILNAPLEQRGFFIFITNHKDGPVMKPLSFLLEENSIKDLNENVSPPLFLCLLSTLLPSRSSLFLGFFCSG
jgi:hypothetical protein